MKRNSLLMTALFTLSLIGCTNTPNAQSRIQPSPSEAVGAVQTQTDPLAQAQRQPNIKFDVERQAGTCPDTVGLWMFVQGFEGGADHTVVADTQAIASQSAKLVVNQPKRLEYEAPLRSEYASCIGQAKSDQFRAYNFQFGNGKVRFRTDVGWSDGYTEVLYKGISASRPYIHWQATE
ncbi:MAG: hypothetical protein KME06_06745 [Kastovskya adunca ATA6-11-RM4]|jgi:hypothetical protein|nr:hypothetical protein [Kastovskya adunca ATA6-11-RM4]